MKRFMTLYMKEMKKIRAIWLFFLLMYGLALLQYMVSPSQSSFTSQLSLTFIMPPAIAAAPAVFGFSLNDELKKRMLYQLHSLPFPRYLVMLGKYLAALSASWVPIIGYLCLHYYYNVSAAEMRYMMGTSLYEDLFAFISIQCWLLGIASLIAGVMLAFLRYRSLIGVAMIFISIYVTTLFIRIFTYLYRLINIDILHSESNFYLFSLFLLIGILYTVNGLFLYQRYAEV